MLSIAAKNVNATDVIKTDAHTHPEKRTQTTTDTKHTNGT